MNEVFSERKMAEVFVSAPGCLLDIVQVFEPGEQCSWWCKLSLDSEKNAENLIEGRRKYEYPCNAGHQNITGPVMDESATNIMIRSIKLAMEPVMTEFREVKKQVISSLLLFCFYA